MTRRAELQFNAQVGNRIGRPIRRRTANQQPRTTNQSRVGRVARGSPTVPSRIISQYRRQTGQTGGGRRRVSGTPSQDPLQAIYTDLTNKFITNAHEQQAIDAANEAKDASDRPWLADVWNAVGGGLGLIDNGTGFAGSIIGRGLDLYSRPSYGLFEGINRLAAIPESGQGYNAEDLWGAVQNFGSGIGAGLAGKEKTGFGEVWETLKNNPDSSTGSALQTLEENHPLVEQRLSQAFGASGELFLDPTNWVSFGAPSVIRRGLLHAGRVGTEDVLRETTLDLVRNSTDELLQSGPLMAGSRLIRNDPQLLADRLLNSVGDSFDNAVLSVHGGGRRGAVRMLNDPGWAGTVANTVGREADNAFKLPFQQQAQTLWDNALSMSEPDILLMQQHSGFFDDLFKELGDELVNTGKLPVNASIDDVIQAIGHKAIPESRFNEIVADITSHIDQEIDPVVQRAFADASRQTTRSIGVRVGSHQIPVIPVGRAFGWIGTKLDHGIFPSVHTMLNDTVFERAFGGLFSLKTGRARALGMAGMEQFKADLKDMARKYSAEEGKLLAKHLETGVRFGDQRMDDALDWLMAKNRAMFGDELGVGARNALDPTQIAHPRYAHVHLKGGSNKARRAYREGRSAAYKTHGNPGADFSIGMAKKMGLRPEENAFENLLQKYIVSRSRMTQAYFRDDLVKGYGSQIKNLTAKSARARGLTEIPTGRLARNWRQALEQVPGSKMYVPKEMGELAEKFEAMSNWSPAEWGRLGRTWANVIKNMKMMLTLPNTGTHMRNFIGDVFMGLLDDVNPNAYYDMMKIWLANKAGKVGATLHIIKGNPALDLTFSDLKRLYKENVDAGFFRTDVGTYASATAGNIPRNMGRRIVSTATGLADDRELIGRYTHFYAAYQDEAQALWNRGMRDTARIQQRAIDAAMWRVNGYKFDYSALMPWEQSLKTAVFPFYTYLRKAIPTIMENMYMNPHYFATLNRFMEYNDGSAADTFNNDNIPKWIRDIGFGLMGNESDPWAITADVLPMGALDIMGSQGASEFSGNIIQNMNPMLQMIPELASGRDALTGQPINTDLLPYLANNAPLIGEIADEFTNPGNQSWAERLLTDRLIGAGISARHITPEQQLYQQNQNRDEAIDIPLRNFNQSQDTYYIAVTENFTYRITNKYTGETVGEYRTPTAAIGAANRLPAAGNNRPFVSPYEQPTVADAQLAFDQGYRAYPQ